MTKLKILWSGTIKGDGKVISEAGEIPIAIPDHLQGSGNGLDPKTLLISSAATCFFMTFKHLIEARKLPVTDFSMESAAPEMKNGNLTITHYPELVLSQEASDEDVDSIKRAIEAADKSCAVGNLLKAAGSEILIEPHFTKSK